MKQLSRLNRTNINHFKIEANVPGSLQKTTIPPKKLIKYLGVHLDYLLRGNKHIDIQARKSQIAFRANTRFFFNKNLTRRTNVILYLLLVRPILSYAAPIWWNINVSAMETLRKLERRCLRACLKLYRWLRILCQQHHALKLRGCLQNRQLHY